MKDIMIAVFMGVGTVVGFLTGMGVLLVFSYYAIRFFQWSFDLSELWAGGIFVFLMICSAMSWGYWKELQNKQKKKQTIKTIKKHLKVKI